jgi:hypothetical protein
MTDEKPTLENLPIHALRSKCKEKGIKTRNTDKKKDLIAMLVAGDTIHKERKPVAAPNLGDSRQPKSIPLIPKEIKGQLEQLESMGLTWSINEDSSSIVFDGTKIKLTANLDSPAVVILNAALKSMGK